MPKRPRAKLKWSIYDYTPAGLRQHDERELRKEYNRLRRIANQRLSRFEGTEWTETQAYKQNVDRYIPIADIKSSAELRSRLADLARFVNAKRSSVRGNQQYRREVIESLHDQGYTFVNNKNFLAFTEFMDAARAARVSELYDSERILDLYNEAEKRKIEPKDIYQRFTDWVEKLDDLKATPPPDKKSKMADSDYYRQKLGI